MNLPVKLFVDGLLRSLPCFRYDLEFSSGTKTYLDELFLTMTRKSDMVNKTNEGHKIFSK